MVHHKVRWHCQAYYLQYTGYRCVLIYISLKLIPLVHVLLTQVISSGKGFCISIWTLLNSLAPGRLGCHFKTAILNLVLLIGIFTLSKDNALRWMPRKLTDDKSTLVQVMAWCCQATNHYLSQCWPSSMSPYGVTRPQCVKLMMTTSPIQNVTNFKDVYALSNSSAHKRSRSILMTSCKPGVYIDGLFQDCSNSNVLAMELLHSCTKPYCGLTHHYILLLLFDVVLSLLDPLHQCIQECDGIWGRSNADFLGRSILLLTS